MTFDASQYCDCTRFGSEFCPNCVLLNLTVQVTVHHDILIIKPTRCTNFSNSFLEQKFTCFGRFLCPSSGVFHCTQQWYMSYRFADCCEQDGTQFRPDPARKLSANLYDICDIYHCCVYSEKLLMMDRETLRNM